MQLSVIIVSWNTVEYLDQCLASIHDNPPSLEFEVWVVDNASNDGSAERVRQAYPQVRLLENEQNTGFATANNQAIRNCTGQYVLLLNPDTEVLPGALDTLLRYLDSHPTCGAAGARLLNSDGTLQHSCYRAPTLGRELADLFHLFQWSRYNMAVWDLKQSREVDVLLGACIMLRREVLERVGLMDESYFMYSEEVDLCYRVRQAGWSIYWVPDARIVHHGGQSTRQAAPEMFLQLYRGKLHYFRKNHGWLDAQLYKLILLKASLARLFLMPIGLLFRSSDKERVLELAGHYWMLVRKLPRL
jgi:N-acetylglucosaminyl-diphospho-decaprenol L-rhamnosyltransferase